MSVTWHKTCNVSARRGYRWNKKNDRQQKGDRKHMTIRRLRKRKIIVHRGFLVIAQQYTTISEDGLHNLAFWCAIVPEIDGYANPFREGNLSLAETFEKGMNQVDHYIRITAYTGGTTEREVIERYGDKRTCA